MINDTKWKCDNCGNGNSEVNFCINCGKERKIITTQINNNPEIVNSTKSKSEGYYEEAWTCFCDGFGESDNEKSIGYLTKAHGYLTMAYKEAGNNVEEKKGIAGLTALVLRRRMAGRSGFT